MDPARCVKSLVTGVYDGLKQRSDLEGHLQARGNNVSPLCYRTGYVAADKPKYAAVGVGIGAAFAVASSPELVTLLEQAVHLCS